MKKHVLLFIILLLVFAGKQVSATDGPITTAPKIFLPTPLPTQVTVPVTVTNFSDVDAVSLKMVYNANLLTYVSAAMPNAFGPNLIAGASVSSGVGTVTISSYTASATALSDGAVLVNITFSVASGGGTSMLTWNDNGTSCEYQQYSTQTPYNDIPTSTFYLTGFVTNMSVTFSRDYDLNTITANPTGGASPYTYSWTGQGGFTAGNVATITPVTGAYGNYTVTITDNTGAVLVATYYYGPVHNIDKDCDFATIQRAIDTVNTVNGNTLVADDGTYAENVIVNKQLTIIGNNGVSTRPIVNGSATAQVFLVTVPNVTIKHFDIRVSQATTISGIKTGTSGTFNNLTIDDCYIWAFGTTGTAIFNSFGICIGTFGGASNDLVNITNCYIDRAGAGFSFFGRGIRLFNYYGSITGSNLVGFYSIQAGDNGGGTITIHNNNLYGSCEINNLTAAATFYNNDCFPANAYGPGTDAVLLELKNISDPSGSLNIHDNNFKDYLYYGVFAGRVNNVTIDNNIFTPDVNATSYRSVCLNTKQRTSVAQSAFTNGMTLKRNDFKGNTATDQAGIAFEIANYDNVSSFGTITLGTSGYENTFRGENSQFIVLNNETGSAPSTGFWAGTYASTMAKVTTNIDARNNLFETSPPTLPADMTLTQLFALEDNIQHKIDDGGLGFVLVKTNNDFVTPLSFISPATTAPSIQRGVNAAGTPGWTVNVNSGLYKESNIAVNKAITILGFSQADVVVAPAGIDGNFDNSFEAPYQYAFLVGSSNVTISNLTIDGQANTALGSGNNFRAGVMTDHRLLTLFSNIEVSDLIINHTYRKGIQIYSGLSTKSTGHVIHGNTIDDVTLGPAINIFDGDVSITGNTISNVPGRTGIEVVQYSATGPVHSIIQGNILTEVVAGIQTVMSDGTSMIGGPDPEDPNTINLIGELDINGDCGVGITLRNADGGATVQNNEVTGSATDAGIWMYDNGSEANPVNITGNILTTASSASDFTGFATGIFMTDDGAYFPNGDDEPGPNVPVYASITNNTITGFKSGISLLGNGTTESIAEVSANILNNSITGGSTGVMLYDYNGTTGGFAVSAIINDNNLSGNTSYGVDAATLAGSVVNGECNWWGINSVAGVAAEVNGTAVDYDPWLINGSDVGDPGFIPGGTCTGAANLYVNDLVADKPTNDIYTTAVGNNSNPGTSTAPFLTITKAVNTAMVGTSIWVDAGTFQEQIQIDKSLNITGVDRTKTIIQAPETMNQVTTVNGSSYPIIFASGEGNTINIQKILIDGDGGRAYTKYEGIHYFAAGGTFNLNRITGIRNTTYDGSDDVALVANHQWDHTISQLVTVTNNIIDDYGKGGIVINELNTHGIVTGNTVTGQNIPNKNGQNGIQFGYGSYGTITGNTVTNNLWNAIEHPHVWTAAGILIVGVGVDNFGAATGNATVIGDNSFASDNILSGNEVGLSIGIDEIYGYNNNAGLTVNANTFENNNAHVWGVAASDVNGSNDYDKTVLNPALTNIVFGCIQYAVDEADPLSDPPNQLTASAGTYAENVVVHTPVSILGPKAAVDGCDPSRGTGEAIVIPSYNDFVDGVVFNVQVNKVTIKGFTIDGNNPLLSGGTTVFGTNVNAVAGICNGLFETPPWPDVDHLTFQNNVIKNFVSNGIYIGNEFGANHSWNYILNNKFEKMREGVQTYALHADISNNCMTSVNRGISIHGTNTACDEGFTAGINSNDISISWGWIYPGFSRGVGIWVNYRREAASDLVVYDNTIRFPEALPSGKTGWGFYALTIDNNRTVNFNENTVLGEGNCKIGYYTTAVASTNVKVNGGSFTGITDYGVLASTYDSQWGAGDAKVTLDNVDIATGTDGVGVKAFMDPAGSSNIATINVTNNCSITGGAVGILADGANASVNVTDNDATISGNLVGIDIKNGGDLTSCTNNTITGNTNGGIIIESDAGTIGPIENNTISNNGFTAYPAHGLGLSNATETTIDASPNYWGDATGPYNTPQNPCGLGNAVVGPATFSPWYYGSDMSTYNGLTPIAMTEIPDVSTITATPVILATTVSYQGDIENYDPTVKTDAVFTSDEIFPDNARVISVKYNGTELLGTPYNIPNGVNVLYLSDVLGAVNPLFGHDGLSINWEFTLDGFDQVEVYTIRLDAVSYITDKTNCNNVLGTQTFVLTFANATFAVNEVAPTVCYPAALAFNAVITYPLIQNVDTDVKTDAYITSTGYTLPAGTKIKWGYNAPPATTYTLDSPASTIYLSDIVAGGVPGPLQGNAGTDTWNFEITGYGTPSTSMDFTLTMQPMARLNGTNYNYTAGDNTALSVLNCSISGNVKYFNTPTTLLKYVKIELYQGGSKVYPRPGDPDISTGTSGLFTMPLVAPGQYDVVLTTTLANNPVGSINSTDAAQVHHWPTGTPPATIEKVRFYSGDVQGNNKFLNADDATRIQQFFVSGLAFDRAPWSFWRVGETISSNFDIQPDYPKVEMPLAGPGLSDINFYGMASGDFNRSFIPYAGKAGVDNLSLVYTDNLQANASTDLVLPIYAVSSMTLGAASLVLNFPADLVEVTGVSMNNASGNLDWMVKGNELRIGWNTPSPASFAAGEKVMSLNLRTRAEFTRGNTIRFTMESNPLNELADGFYDVIPNAELGIGVIESGTFGIDDQPGVDGLSLSNHPNPFKDITTVAYDLPFEGRVILDVYSILGIKVATLVNARQTEGSHSFEFRTSILEPGVYIATLKLQDENQTLTRSIKIVRNR